MATILYQAQNNEQNINKYLKGALSCNQIVHCKYLTNSCVCFVSMQKVSEWTLLQLKETTNVARMLLLECLYNFVFVSVSVHKCILVCVLSQFVYLHKNCYCLLSVIIMCQFSLDPRPHFPLNLGKWECRPFLAIVVFYNLDGRVTPIFILPDIIILLTH